MRAIKMRIYPNNNQKKQLNQSFGCTRFVYNRALYLKRKRWEDYKENLSINEISKMLTFWKKTDELSFLKEANAQGLQQTLRHLDSAYKKFFKEKKGYPKFKKKGEGHFFSVVGNVSIQYSKIKFPKIGLINCRGMRKFNGIIKTATISKNPSNQYFISFCVDDLKKNEKLKIIEKSIGIDVGIKTIATLSNGEKYYAPNYLKEIENKLKYYQRKQSKAKKGSRAFRKWKLKIARIWNKIVNIKNDFLHKLSINLVKNHDLISVEKLQIKNMVKNHKLAKSILNMNWGGFFRQLEYKCEWYGKHFVKVDPKKTSQTCSNCNHVNNKLTLDQREWICESCKSKLDRDINAAININKKGVDSVLKSCGDILIRGIYETRTLCFYV